MPSQYDNPKTLKDKKLCLQPVSKNLVEGTLQLLTNSKDCQARTCKTIKLTHTLKVLVRTNPPCDSAAGKLLDGILEVKELVTEELAGAAGRGIHAGNFTWTSTDGSIVVVGALTGFNNIGPHRRPFTTGNENCDQPCNPRLVMEGRLTGKYRKSPEDKFKDCEVLAAYRLRLDQPETEKQSRITGTLEGVIICPCPQ